MKTGKLHPQISLPYIGSACDCKPRGVFNVDKHKLHLHYYDLLSTFIFQYTVDSVLKLCDKMIMEDQSVIDELDDINSDTNDTYHATLQDQCDIIVGNIAVGTQAVY